jgi:hypothetical protein
VLEPIPLPVNPQADLPGQIQVFQFVCGTCNKLIFESQAQIARSSGRPDIRYILCVGCGEAENRAQLARRIVREVVCDKCGRVVNAFVDPGTDTVRYCSVCTPAERQPQERETFCAKAVMGKKARRLQHGREYEEFRKACNDDASVREQIFSPGHVEESQRTLEDMTVRDIQKHWNLSYHSAREGKIGILRLKTDDLEIPPMPPPRKIVHKMGRKCEHGMWKHRDDRKKSRHCSACYPNVHAHLVEWKEQGKGVKNKIRLDLETIPVNPQSPISQDVTGNK